MAQPLTSSDIIRERMGFGVSDLASQETRKAYASAGLSPLGTQERQRFAAGTGMSPMESATGVEAWKMAEFMAGQRGQAPVEYGGIGERPTGTSRRAIRMQQAWDEAQKQQLEQQRLTQQMDAEQERLAIERSRESRLLSESEAIRKASLAKEMREEEMSRQAQSAMNSVLGYTRPDGVRVSPININEDDAVERIQSVIAMNPFGMEKQYVKETIGGLLDDAMKVRESKLSAAQQAELSALDMSIRSGKPMSAFGQYDEQGKFIPSPQAMAIESTKLKMAEEQAGVEKEIKKEKRAEQKDIQSQVNLLSRLPLLEFRSIQMEHLIVLVSPKGAETC